MILSLNLARSNLYGGREAVGVKLAQLFFIPLHFFHLSPAFRSLYKLFFPALLQMTPGLLGFHWTVAQIQAIRVVVTFVLKKKETSSDSLWWLFFLFVLRRPKQHVKPCFSSEGFSFSKKKKRKIRKVGMMAASGFFIVEARRSSLLVMEWLQTAGRPPRERSEALIT